MTAHIRSILPLAAFSSICLVLALIATPSAEAQTAVKIALQQTSDAQQRERQQLREILRENSRVLEAQAAVLKAVSKLVGPAVVHIEADVVHSSLRHGREGHIEEAGSGVIIQREGKYYVLTNRHVVGSSTPEGIEINLSDGRQIRPTKVWEDPATDVAVMAVSAPNLTAADIGNSDKLEIGDFVLAVGSPFGLSQSVTFGIISAKGRRDLQLGDAAVRFQDFMQTDAAINPGNSGGPLVNLRGEIVGINTAIASNSGGNEGIGFSIPINMVMIVGDQLVKYGRVQRAFLGVNLDSKFGAVMAAKLGLPFPMGAGLRPSPKARPAESADVKVGDVILEFNNIRVEDDSHLVNIVSLTEVGKKVPLVIYRDGKTFRIEVEVGDRSKLSRQR